MPKSSDTKVTNLHAVILSTQWRPRHVKAHVELTRSGPHELLYYTPALVVTGHPDAFAGKTDNFSKFTAAYQETQPKPLYAEEEEADEN